MSDETERPEAPAPRGEAAWKANLDRVNASNEEARKVGRLERKAHDERTAATRDAVDKRERIRMSSQKKGSAGTGKAYMRGDS
jgi:hypothetical protein